MKTVTTQGFAPLGGGGRNALLARHSAFTLAEVLITLGIIGIVAAMTIPTLMRNYQERSWQTSASTFEAKFGQALKVMNTQNTLAGLGSTENFVAELQRHMKINKVCDNSKLTECFPDINAEISSFDVVTKKNEVYRFNPNKFTNINSSAFFGHDEWNTNTAGIQFANGVSAVLAYNPKCKADPFNANAIGISGKKNSIKFDTDCVAVMYDVNAFSSPNILGNDVRLSSYANVDNACMFLIDGTCVNNLVFPSRSYTQAECNALKEAGKLFSCQYENDYWAAAVDMCGGTDKMTTEKQLKQLAVYLYGTENIIDDGFTCENTRRECNGTNVQLNPDFTTKLGLPAENFSVYSNNGYAPTGVYYRLFGTNETAGWSTFRTTSFYALCVNN